jgi:hypothetical protein
MVSMSTSTTPSDESRQAARTLIEERATLEAWLAKLEERAGSVPSHVADRVRGDYLDRLRRVTEDLGEHLDTVREDYDSVRSQLGDASARHAEAVDRLEELRLRHLIGEVAEDAWDDQRRDLEKVVEDTQARRAELESEMEHVEDLLTEVEEANRTAPTERSRPVAERKEPQREAAPDYLDYAAEDPEPVEALAEPSVSSEQPADMILDDLVDPSTLAMDDEPPAEDEPEAAPVAEAETPREAPAETSWDTDEEWEPNLETVEEEPDLSAESGLDDQLPWLDAVIPPKGEPAGEAFDDLDFLRSITGEQRSAEAEEESEPVVVERNSDPEPSPPEEEDDDDLAFLADLDRVISGVTDRNEAAKETEKGGARKAVACKDCAAPNDARSWYCEVCGSELG